MKKIILLVAALAGMLFAKSVEIGTPPKHKDGANHLELVLVLDKSGSMRGLESDTIGGFNSMIEKECKEGIDASVTTVLFDTKFNVIHGRTPLKKVKNLTSKENSAGGKTALLDAIGSTIARIERVPDIYAKNNRVLFVIITDGYENSSREYSRAQIKKMISDKQEKYDWEFIFLGANIDAASEAQSIGIKSENALKYENSKEGVSKNFEAAAEISKDVATDNKANSKWRDKVLQDKK